MQEKKTLTFVPLIIVDFIDSMSNIPAILNVIILTLTDHITICIQYINHITIQVLDFVLISRISKCSTPTYIRSINIYT